MRSKAQNFPMLFAAFALGAYPALRVTVDGAGSALWYILGTAGLLALTLSGKKALNSGSSGEVKILGSLLTVFLLFSFVNQAFHGLDDFSTSRLERQALLLLTIPIFYLITTLNISQKALFRALTISGILFFIYFLTNSHVTRLDGVVHAIHFGNIAMVTMLLSIPALITNSNAIWRAVSITAFSGALLAFIYAGSRGGLVALILTVAGALLFWLVHRKFIFRFIVTTVALVIILIVSVQIIDPLNKRYDATVVELNATRNGQFDNSIGIRLQLWNQALAAAQKNYFTGTGYYAYRGQLLDSVSSGELSPFYGNFASEPHSQALFQLSATGGVGVTLLLLLFFTPIILILKKSQLKPNIFETCIILSIAALFLCGLTVTLFDQRRIIQIFGLLYVLAARSLQIRNETSHLTATIQPPSSA